jgi:hypothetical protein
MSFFTELTSTWVLSSASLPLLAMLLRIPGWGKTAMSGRSPEATLVWISVSKLSDWM